MLGSGFQGSLREDKETCEDASSPDLEFLCPQSTLSTQGAGKDPRFKVSSLTSPLKGAFVVVMLAWGSVSRSDPHALGSQVR